MLRCAYVTYRNWNAQIDDDTDLAPAVAALSTFFETEVAVWDDESVEWDQFDVVCVRSVWDYVPQRAKFLSWVDRVSRTTKLLNPAVALHANSDKQYLIALEAAGVPIVPTSWIARVEDIDHAVDAWAGRRMVVKPRVGAGAWDTLLTDDPIAAKAHATALMAQSRACMVQPYLEEVDREGEVSIVCLNGEPSWAIRKVPALTEGGHGDADQQVELTDALCSAARRVLAAEPIANACVWARVDVVPVSGEYVLMELELTEPMLFLASVPGSADRFAAAVLAALE